MENKLAQRFWEIDLLRAVAIIMMITFHLLFNLNYFGNYDFNLESGFWLVLARVTALIFLMLVGISLSLSFAHAAQDEFSVKNTRLKQLKRGLMIFSWGLIITIITWLSLGELIIIFGVLHLIGISIILAIAFLKLRHWNLVIGIIIILIGILLFNYNFGFPWLIWLGFRPYEYYYVDYFPLLPWFGVILIGIFLGDLLYPHYRRKFKLPELSEGLREAEGVWRFPERRRGTIQSMAAWGYDLAALARQLRGTN